ncbi:hypothetical protein JCM10212_001382 [Sporobolomyces blumeae]
MSASRDQITSQIPSDALNHESDADISALVQIFTTRYSVFSLYSPDLWTISLLFAIAILAKLACTLALNETAVARTRAVWRKTNDGAITKDVARMLLQKPLKAALTRLLTFVIATAAFTLQCCSWRLFLMTSEEPIRFNDVARIYVVVKLLLVGYAADLLFGDHSLATYLHHLFTFLLLLVGEIAVAETKDPRLYRLAQYLLLQGTMLPTLYASLVLYRFRSYLALQHRRPKVQRRLLVATYWLLQATKVTIYPGKLVPAAFSLYWLVKMWNEVTWNGWGRAWLALSVITLSLLLLLQVTKFADDVFPFSAYVGHQLYGGPPPSRHGPLTRASLGLFARRRRARSDASCDSPTAVSDDAFDAKVVDSPPSDSTRSSTETLTNLDQVPQANFARKESDVSEV